MECRLKAAVEKTPIPCPTYLQTKGLKFHINRIRISPDLKALALLLMLVLTVQRGKSQATAVPAPRPGELSGFETEVIGPYPTGPFYAVFSPDGTHLAMAAHEGSQQAVFEDGTLVATCDQLLPLEPNSVATGNAEVLRFAADSSRLFFIPRIGARISVMAGNKEGMPCKRIRQFTSAPAGSGYACLADLGPSKGEAIIWNGVPSPVPSPQYDLRLLFSPNGQHFAYAAGLENGSYLVTVDNKTLSSFLHPTSLAQLQFSLDNEHFAIVAALHQNEVAVLDSKPGPEYAWVTSLCLNANGSRLAFIGKRLATEAEYDAGQGGEAAPKEVRATFPNNHSVERAVIDGKEQGGYHATDLVLHPISGRYAYVDHPSGPWTSEGGADTRGVEVWVDGKRGPEYERCDRIIFSPDGKRVAYLTAKDKRSYVVVDDEELGPFDDIDRTSFVFSANSAHFGFVAGQDVYVDGAHAADVFRASNLAFSPNGSRYAYFANDSAGHPLVVVDGNKKPLLAPPVDKSITFSPDGKRLAFVVATNGGFDQTAVIDDIPIPPFQNQRQIRSLEFSPDSQHVVFTAEVLDRNTINHVRVVDGKPGPLVGLNFASQDHPPVISPTLWTSKGQLSYLAKDGNRLIRLTLSPANLNSLSSINDLAADARRAFEAQAEERAKAELAAKEALEREQAARAQAEADAKARVEAEKRAKSPLQFLHETDIKSDEPVFVVQGPDNELYGAGVAGRFATGVLFRMRPDGTQYEILHRFEGAEESQVVRSLIIAKDGTLYGTTWATSSSPRKIPGIVPVTASLFCCAAGTHEYSLLSAAHERSDGWRDVLSRPLVSVVTSDGLLFGKCNGQMVFRFSTKERSMDVILDATSPWASRFQKDGTQVLVQGGNVTNPKADQLLGDQLLQVGNQLFSVTRGGRGNAGQIVSMGLDGEGYHTVYDFSDQGPEGGEPRPPLVLGPGGLIYGICQVGGDQQGQVGSIFALDAADGNCHPLYRSRSDAGPLTFLTWDGGDWFAFWAGGGSLCRMRIDGSAKNVLIGMTGEYVITIPYSLLFGGDGKLYGAMASRYQSSCIFSCRTSPAGARATPQMLAAVRPSLPNPTPATEQVRAPRRPLRPPSGEDVSGGSSPTPTPADEVRAPRRPLRPPTGEEDTSGSPTPTPADELNLKPLVTRPSSETPEPAQPTESSQAPDSGPPSKIRDDPRYAETDARLNQVYSAVRSRLSPAGKERLKRSEISFLHLRESLESYPNAYFQATESQIKFLELMLKEGSQ
jgi:WD40 repeat protein